MTCAAPKQTSADDTVTNDHDSGEDGVACQSCFFRRICNHDGDDQRHLDNRYGDGEDKRSKWLAGAVRDHLGVIHGGENGGDQDYPCNSGNDTAITGKSRHQQHRPGY